jgi:hypothetical protein
MAYPNNICAFAAIFSINAAYFSYIVLWMDKIILYTPEI